MELLITLFIAAYVAGSINFSILLFKILGKGDPRKGFSGNAGATNVYRQAGIFWATVVLLLDMGRAVGVALAALYILKTDYVLWIGLSLILGNRFPCFHGFRGGKGVANYLGFTAAMTPIFASISALAWGILYAAVRIPFISSFLMILILAGGTVIKYGCNLIPAMGTVITASLICYGHRSNVAELMQRKRGTQKSCRHKAKSD